MSVHLRVEAEQNDLVKPDDTETTDFPCARHQLASRYGGSGDSSDENEVPYW